MRLVDAHCHLYCPEFQGKEETILASAKQVGVVGLISAATQLSDWEGHIRLAVRYPEVKCALGVHPWYAQPEDVSKIVSLESAHEKGAIAIGEIGLDSKIASPPFELQAALFEKQLGIARDLNLPVVVHCRGAFNQLISTVKRVGLPERGGIIHAYSGSPEITQELIRLGFSFSMGRALTYRNSPKRAEVLRVIFPERILLETDSPDLPPVERNGTINEPANLVYMLRAGAELIKVPEETLAEVTFANATRLFDLPL